MDDVSKQKRIIADMDADKDVTLKDVAAVAKDVQDAEIEEITVAAPQLTTTVAPTLTTAPSVARRRKGVVIIDPKETATPSTIIHTEAKSKDKGKGILVKEHKPLKKQAQIEQDEAYARELEAELNKNIDWNKKFNSNVAFLKKTKEQMDAEDGRALKRLISNEDDDVYTEAIPLALKVPVVDYKIYTENNKPYYKFKRADGSHQLYLSFLSILRIFDREDLEVLWQMVKERFASTKPKNFSDDFLLTTLGAMFEKQDI
nr:hypothetical protein [Tanacetum cinerariifolium]